LEVLEPIGWRSVVVIHDVIAMWYPLKSMNACVVANSIADLGRSRIMEKDLFECTNGARRLMRTLGRFQRKDKSIAML